jgi:hypothetical protein
MDTVIAGGRCQSTLVSIIKADVVLLDGSVVPHLRSYHTINKSNGPVDLRYHSLDRTGNTGCVSRSVMQGVKRKHYGTKYSA